MNRNPASIPHSAFRISHSAFTLLELVMVLLILAIMCVIVIPTMGPFMRGRAIQEAATNTISLTNFARTQSISQSRTYRLNIGDNELWLTCERDGIYDQPLNGLDRRVKVPSSIRMECDAARSTDGTYIRFFPSGRSDTAEIRFESEKTVKRVVNSSPTEPFQIVSGD